MLKVDAAICIAPSVFAVEKSETSEPLADDHNSRVFRRQLVSDGDHRRMARLTVGASHSGRRVCRCLWSGWHSLRRPPEGLHNQSNSREFSSGAPGGPTIEGV